MEKRICRIVGCNKPIQAASLCSMHYSRVRNDNKDMRPGPLPLWKLNDPRRKNNLPCEIDGCTKTIYAKGLCSNHYNLKLRTGGTIYLRDIPKPKCSMEDCDNLATSLTSGLCQFHKKRQIKGIPLDRPKGIRGPLNPNWNGGIAQYPNHYEMKKVRLEVLEEANYRCYYCGKHTNQIHHKDQIKSNHDKSNIVACCSSCNQQPGRRKISTSKYRRLYGKTIIELADKLDVTNSKVRTLHKLGQLTLYMHEEIKAILW